MENTSNAYTAGTKTHADPAPGAGAEPGPTPAQRLGANTSHAMQPQVRPM